MLVNNLAPLQSASPRTPANPAGLAAPGLSFQDALTQASAALEAKATSPVDAKDEDEALKELFHLLAMLSLGIVDTALLDKKDAAKGSQPGPVRREVEALKAVIRRLLRRGQDDEDGMEVDPVTGKAQPKISTEALFQSLPSELQGLLRRAFPQLDDFLREEAAKASQQDRKPA